MLVSKIKPCMSKHKLLHSEAANGSLGHPGQRAIRRFQGIFSAYRGEKKFRRNSLKQTFKRKFSHSIGVRGRSGRQQARAEMRVKK